MDSMSTIDQKMAEMKIKNMELLKRHQVCSFSIFDRSIEPKLKQRRRERRRDEGYLSSKKRSILFSLLCSPHILSNVIAIRRDFFDNFSLFVSSILSSPSSFLFDRRVNTCVQNEGYRVSADVVKHIVKR